MSLDRLAALLEGTVPGAGYAASRVLNGWTARATRADTVATTGAIELRRRGVAEGASPATRLDALASLVALARVPLPPRSSVLSLALDGAALVATVADAEMRPHVEAEGRRAPADVSRCHVAAHRVLSALVATGAEWHAMDVEDERRAWKGPAREDPRPMLELWQAGRIAAPWLSPPPTPSAELVGNLADDLARDADYIAARTPALAPTPSAPAVASPSARTRRTRDPEDKAARLALAWHRDPGLIGESDTAIATASGLTRSTVSRLVRSLAAEPEDHAHGRLARAHVERKRERDERAAVPRRAGPDRRNAPTRASSRDAPDRGALRGRRVRP